MGNGSAYTCSIGGAFSYDAGQKVGTLTRNGNSPSLTVYLGQKRAWPNENSPWYHVSYDVRIPEGADQAQWTLGNLPFQTPGSDGGWQGFIVTPKYVQDGDGWAIDFGPDNAASYEKRPADLREWTTIDIWLDCTSGESTDVYIGVNGELKGPYTSSYYVQELQSLAFSSNNVTDASQLQIRNVYAAMTESGPK